MLDGARGLVPFARALFFFFPAEVVVCFMLLVRRSR